MLPYRVHSSTSYPDISTNAPFDLPVHALFGEGFIRGFSGTNNGRNSSCGFVACGGNKSGGCIGGLDSRLLWPPRRKLAAAKWRHTKAYHNNLVMNTGNKAETSPGQKSRGKREIPGGAVQLQQVSFTWNNPKKFLPIHAWWSTWPMSSGPVILLKIILEWSMNL